MPEQPGAVHLLDYWTVLRRRRWVVYLAVSACLLAALIGSFLKTPLYRATASLHIQRLTPDILTFQDLSRTDNSFAAYSDFYQTQYKILSSEAVARRAVERLGLTSHPLFDLDAREPGLLARFKSLIPRKSAPAADTDPLEAASARIRGSLEITPVRNSQLVHVSWISSDPELAAQVSNAVVDAYIQFNLQSQYSISEQATEFLVDQIGQLKREIAAIEERLQEYGESKRIVSIDDNSNITLQALADISQRRTEAQTRLAQKEAEYTSVRNSSPDALPEAMNSPLISRLKQDYAVYEAEYTEKSKLFKEDWPGLLTLKSKLDQAGERLRVETERIAKQVLETAESDYRTALNEVRNLDALLERQEGAAQKLRRDAVEFANLRSEVDKKRETLDALIARQNEMALSTRLQDLDATSTNIRVVDRARVPGAPFKPSTKLNLLLGLALGIALGVGMAFFLDYLDNTISSPAQIEALTRLPLLSVIPRHGAVPGLSRVRRRTAPAGVETVDLVTHRDGKAGASEAYRELRTAILLSSAGEAPRQIMITSALPEEGKSATALNLAVVLAQLGRRVLLVDTDLRRPRLHKPFRLDSSRGVTTYLSGLEPDPLQLIVATGIEGLDVLVSGPTPPNPSELLDSKMFAGLGARCLEHGYDHVIFDSPPALSVADPVIIANAVDAVIVVVRAEKTPRQSLRHAVEKLEQASARPAGIVLNDLRADSHRYRGYYYYGHYTDKESDAGRSRASGS